MVILILLGELGIIDPLVKKFGSFRELKKYAKVAPDPELLGKIKVCTPLHGRTSMCDYLSYAVTSQKRPRIYNSNFSLLKFYTTNDIVT